MKAYIWHVKQANNANLLQDGIKAHSSIKCETDSRSIHYLKKGIYDRHLVLCHQVGHQCRAVNLDKEKTSNTPSTGS